MLVKFSLLPWYVLQWSHIIYSWVLISHFEHIDQVWWRSGDKIEFLSQRLHIQCISYGKSPPNWFLGFCLTTDRATKHE